MADGHAEDTPSGTEAIAPSHTQTDGDADVVRRGGASASPHRLPFDPNDYEPLVADLSYEDPISKDRMHLVVYYDWKEQAWLDTGTGRQFMCSYRSDSRLVQLKMTRKRRLGEDAEREITSLVVRDMHEIAGGLNALDREQDAEIERERKRGKYGDGR